MAGEFAESLPESWQVCRLDEVATIVDSLHKTPTYSETGRAMVRVTDVQGGFLDVSKTLRVDEEVFQEFTRRYTPKRGDIVFSRVGSYGNASYANSDTPFCLGQNTALISPKINGRFLHLFLQSPYARRQIEQAAVGSTQKTISLKNISALEIPVPPVEELEAIASILGTLDDKIELNRRMNETLEAIARAIFKSWFVDFGPVRAKASGEPPESICRRLGLTPDLLAFFPDRLVDSELGEIPEGWKWSAIGDQVEILGGGTPSTKESKYWDDGTYNWTTPKDLSGNPDKVLVSTERKITQKGLETISSGLLPAGTVLMSSRAPVGYLAIAKNPTAINQGFIAMKCHKLLTPEYVLQWAESVMDEIKQRASGTTFAEISKKNFRLIKVLVPTAQVMLEYTTIAQGQYDRITANVAESNSLSGIRDTLLPKLLNGELSVTELINE